MWPVKGDIYVMYCSSGKLKQIPYVYMLCIAFCTLVNHEMRDYGSYWLKSVVVFTDISDSQKTINCQCNVESRINLITTVKIYNASSIRNLDNFE